MSTPTQQASGFETIVDSLRDRFGRDDPELGEWACQFAPERHAALLQLARETPDLSRDLWRFATRQVCARHNLISGQAQPEDPAQLAALAADPLCLLVLTEAINSHLAFERFLTRARRHLLALHPDETAVIKGLRPLLVALAQQAFNNEYVFPATEAEELKVTELAQACQLAARSGDWRAVELELLLHSLYRPLAELPSAADLVVLPLERLSPDLHPLIRRTLHEPRRESELRSGLPSLVGVEDQASRLVRRQYEESPYPRWIRLMGKRLGLREKIRQWKPGFDWPADFRGKPLQVLVAGCGTGQHPLQVAVNNPDSNVLAVDLSTASLAYAARQAEQLGVRNVAFLQGDILALRGLGRTFHHIECVGVLHHLRDHEAGWAVLTDCLCPGGTMNLGLYGRGARLLVTHLRACIAREDVPATPRGVREFRRCLIEDPRWAGLLPRLADAGDFFSLSMMRDLLFHVQEHHYTTEEIEAMTRRLGLELLAVRFSRRLRSQIKTGWPEVPLPVSSFTEWRALEQAYVGSLEMFMFWLRKPSNLGCNKV